MRRRLTLLAFVLAIPFLGGSGCCWWRCGNGCGCSCGFGHRMMWQPCGGASCGAAGCASCYGGVGPTTTPLPAPTVIPNNQTPPPPAAAQGQPVQITPTGLSNSPNFPTRVIR